MGRKPKPEAEQSHDEKVQSVNALLGVGIPDGSIDNEPKPGEIEKVDPFTNLAHPPTLDSGHYAYVEDGVVICKRCGRGTDDFDEDAPCDVCEPLLDQSAAE